MDTAGLIVLPRADDPLDADLREVDVAIELVPAASRSASGSSACAVADRSPPIALAHAQSAGVDFRVDGSGDRDAPDLRPVG